MIFYLTYLSFLIIFLFILNNYFIKKKFLISETGDKHQKFASNIKTPLTGGLLIFLSFLYLFNQLEIYFIFFSFMIFLLGIFSDIKFIKSAKVRLFLQILLIITFVILNETQIVDTRIFLLDKFLTSVSFNYIFVVFCILIVVNGSNFFDGLNTLSIGYYLLVALSIFYLNSRYYININETVIMNLILVLSIALVLNIFNKIFLGDSGSYLLGFIFAVFLIDLYTFNRHISPFFIIFLLWYPSYELLFSMIRKIILKRSPLDPDSNHLHQLVFYSLKKRNSLNPLRANLLSAVMINTYNLIIFLISMNYITNTQIQIILILLNLIMYTVIYFKLFVYRYKKI